MKHVIYDALQKVKCALGIHREERWHYNELYSFRTTRKGRSKKKWYSVKVCITETRCKACGKILKRNRKIKW